MKEAQRKTIVGRAVPAELIHIILNCDTVRLEEFHDATVYGAPMGIIEFYKDVSHFGGHSPPYDSQSPDLPGYLTIPIIPDRRNIAGPSGMLLTHFYNPKRGITMKKLLFLTIAMLIAGTISAYAASLPYYEYFNTPVNQSDTENITNSGRVSENTMTPAPASIVNMDGELPETSVKSISIEAIYADNIQTYNIPLSYGFPLSLTGNKELLNLKLVLPYTVREVGTASDSGLGDVSLTTNYLIRFPSLLLDSKLVVKAPTGEYEDADVALGTGSTDVGLYINGSYYMDKLIIKGGLGYGYNGTYDQDGDKLVYGDEILVSAGLDYKITDTMKAGGLFIYKTRSEDKVDYASSLSPDVYIPGINNLDFIPNFTYFYSRYNVEIIATATIPVTDSWNTDKAQKPNYDQDRSASFGISCSKPF